MKGLGVDIIEIERIKDALERHSRFKERFFTAAEREYCAEYKQAAPHYAGRFAAKEAVVKALGTGFSGFKWQDVEVVAGDQGQPQVKLYNQAQQIADQQGIDRILLSISHSRDYAVAEAITL